ncbi:unnamed protein product [Owenia fusiformis]|uniref:Uncharacterized protein n=1 Tax=Owenia fusiformis TaxID=6347 RepID=A0A8J1UBG7_OWEFU|nr:unnamed protein product [Owenia fusiformis]
MLTLAVFVAGLAAVMAEGYGSRCFDCNYAPSGYSYQSDYWKRSTTAGYEGCALANYDDADNLDKWTCKSGRCFIRRDKNGLVYRGCADEENLPLGVNSYSGCQYVAGSQWYFCKGDLCNKGQIGDYGHCDYKPSYRSHSYNPCDGKCYGNPSGLFKDNYNPYGFIQCGCDYKYDAYSKTSKACICCKPLHVKCPKGTAFNDYAKVCDTASYTAPHAAPVHHAPVHHAPAYPSYHAPAYPSYH